MKTIKMAFVAVVVLASVSFAQGGGGGRGGAGGGQGRGGGGVARLLMGVTDSAAVSAKATEIFTKYAADIQAGRGARGAPVDSTSEAFKKAQTATKARNDEIKALLTKDADKKKFDENVASGGRRGGGR